MTNKLSGLVRKAILPVAIVGLLAGCGQAEKIYEQSNYESLTNEKVRVLELYSGGKLVQKYEDAKILYSDADATSLWFLDSTGKKHYWQGEALMDF